MSLGDRPAPARDRAAWWLAAAGRQARSPAFWTWVAIAVGIALRMADFATVRDVWLDEQSLALNVVGRPIFELDRPLTGQQMVAPGYLVAIRAYSRLAGGTITALRFPSLVFGILALFALRTFASRLVDPWAVPFALSLAAMSDDLIYYATEFKQYSFDLCVGLVLLTQGFVLLDPGPSRRRAGVAASFGAVAAWFSQTGAFVMGGVCLTLGLDALRRRSPARLATAVGLASIWALNIGGAFLVARRFADADSRAFLWTWWDFAFLPIPPRTPGQAGGLFWTFANVFTNPLGLQTPLGPLPAALIGLGLFAVGVGSFLRRRRSDRLALLLTPLLLTAAASALRIYPFHGRLLVFAVPCVLLPVAQGASALGRRLGPAVPVILLAILLASPTFRAVVLIDKPRWRVADSHGDQRADLLDWLEPPGRIPLPPPRAGGSP